MASPGLYATVEELEQDPTSSGRETAYQLLKAQLSFHENDPEFLWRMAKSAHLLVEARVREHPPPSKHRDLQFEARDYALEALQLQPDSADVRQWCAQTVGGTTRFVGMKEKLQVGYQYKLHIERAVELRPNDARLRHLKGRFCFEVASLSWVERKLAAIFYEEPPSATYQDALADFLEAEKLAPRSSVDNLLQIGRAYWALGNKARAVDYWVLARDLIPSTAEDHTAHAEVVALLAKHS